MIRLMLIQICASFLLAGAHALRAGSPGTAAAALVMAGALFTRREWLRRSAAVILSLWAYEWLSAAAVLIQMRSASGEPQGLLPFIMAAVILFTLASVYILNLERMKEFFEKDKENASPLTWLFILAAALVWFTETVSPGNMLLASRYFPGWHGLQILFTAFYAVWAGKGLLDKKIAPRRRALIWTLFSAVFFVQLGLGLAGMDRMLMSGKLHIPLPALIAAGPVYRGGGLFMPVLYGITLLIAGGAWCSHLCYIGSWDHIASRSLNSRPGTLPVWTKWTRLLTLVLTVGGALIMREYGVSPSAAAASALLFAAAGVFVMIFVSSRRGIMVHCTAFCPIGVISNIAGKISPWRIKIMPSCDRCGACTNVCRYGALRPEDFERGKPGLTCTLCGDCTAVCPGGHILYTLPGISDGRARKYFIVTVTLLHALFLSVARI